MMHRIAVAAALTLTLSVASVAYAGTVQWTGYQFNGTSNCLMYDGGCVSAQQTIQYSADAVDTATGASVCGTTIPAGTSVQFKFAPHTASDYSWFVSGYWDDSPYGTWATLPALTMPQNGGSWVDLENGLDYLTVSSGSGTYSAGGDASSQYAGFINPPVQSVSGLGSNFSCGTPASDGTVTCAAAAAGTVPTAFNFASTYGGYLLSPQNIDSHSGQYWTYVSVDPTTLITNPDPYYAIYVQWWHWYYDYLVSYGIDPVATGYMNSILPEQDWIASRFANDDYYGGRAISLSYTVPAQTISCPITVTPPANNPPSSPTADASGACTVGSNFTISMTSSDPNGDGVYYKVYWLWDTDQTAYERVPAVGTMPSGQLATATHQYASTGSHAIAVIAVDSKGAASNPSTVLHFSCNPAPPLPTATLTADSTHIHVGQSTIVHATYHAGSGDALTADNVDSPIGTGIGATTNPDTAKDITFTPLLPGTYTFYARATTSYYPIWATYADPLTITVDPAPVCTPSDIYTCENNNTTVVKTSTDATCAVTVTRTNCPAGAYCQAGSATCVYPAPLIDVHLKVTPGLVRAGDQTHVKWSVENVASCIVDGTNGDHWTTAVSALLGELSQRIMQQTTYTLTCIGLDGSHPAPESATVTVLPIFIEQ